MKILRVCIYVGLSTFYKFSQDRIDRMKVACVEQVKVLARLTKKATVG